MSTLCSLPWDAQSSSNTAYPSHNCNLTDLCKSNFFAKPNGSKPAPQQAKLSFATKSKPDPKKPKTEDEQEVEDGSSDNKPVATQEDADDATEEAQDDVAPSKPTTTTKKRAVENKEEEEAAASEEEPPTKRQRKKPTKSPSPKKPKQEPASDHEEPIKKEKAAPKKPAAKPPTPAKVEEEDIAMKDGSESDPQSEAEDVESDEEEQPEKAAKARAKVQSTFKSNTKDPYPDWKAGDPVPYAALCTTFSKIEMTTKRLEIMAHCSLFLRQVLRLTPQDLQPTVLLMLGKLAADYAGIELGIGESLIMKAIGESTGRSLKIIKEDQQKIGDLGLVAAKSKGSQPTMFKPKPLTIRGVHEQLMTIAKIEGSGGQGRKVSGIHKLLSAADANLPKGKGVDIEENKGGPSEAKFIVRTLEGKMRLGLADKTVLVSMAQAMTYHDVMTKTNKAPTTEQLEKGERVLKNVYKYVFCHQSNLPSIVLTSPTASFPATKSSFLHIWRMESSTCTMHASSNPVFLSSLCWQNRPSQSPKCSTVSRARTLPANTSTMEREHRFTSLLTIQI
jgi:DNA ligase-1